MTSALRGGLWAHPDFLKLWGGESLSIVGSQVTIIVMPLVAVEYLHASSAQMGILGAAARAPFLLFLFAGVWVDRFRRKRTMIVANLGGGTAIGLIPVLYFAGALNMAWLYGLIGVAGTLMVFFEVANQAFIPSLVGKDLVPEANAKFQVSQSAGQVSGPSLAGLLLLFTSAAGAIVVDAVSYFVGAVATIMIGVPEEKPGGSSQPPRLFAAIRGGLSWVWSQPLIRPMLSASALYVMFTSGVQALYVLYLRHELHLSGTWIAVTLSCLGAGAIVGSLLSLRLLRIAGPGRAMLWATVIGNAAFWLIVFAGGPVWLVIGMLMLAEAVIGMSGPIFGVGVGSVRMLLTPDEMQGRVVATFHGLSLGLAPFGALLGGLAGAALGVHTALLILVVGVQIPIFVILFSPIPRLRSLPDPC